MWTETTQTKHARVVGDAIRRILNDSVFRDLYEKVDPITRIADIDADIHINPEPVLRPQQLKIKNTSSRTSRDLIELCAALESQPQNDFSSSSSSSSSSSTVAVQTVQIFQSDHGMHCSTFHVFFMLLTYFLLS